MADEQGAMPTTVLPDARALKPCPFCGAQAKWVEDNGDFDTPFGLVTEHLETCFLGFRMMAEWDTIITAWNTRATQPASDAAVPAGEVLPQHIGRVHLGERRSDGERLCSHGHPVAVGQALYWPERMGEYPDDMDPLCLEHAIEQVVDDNGWCEKCTANEFAAAPKVASETRCQKCNGSGHCNRASSDECDACGGSGKTNATGGGEVNAWREAVIDGLVVAHIYNEKHDADPRKALHDLICWEVDVAFDPRVSQRAADLLATPTGADLLEQAAVETEVAWEVWEDDLMVASSSSEAEGLRYLEVYSQDGPMRFVKATTTRATIRALSARNLTEGGEK